MDKENNHHHSGHAFMNGLLLGAVIGGGLVFLLGTKKGKKVLKIITEEGLEGVSELKELIENQDEEYEEEDEVPADVAVAEEVHAAASHEEIKQPVTPKQQKRFFRGIGKK
ncbi:MAG: hypothetical protein ACREGI_00895 [Candidatus Levyibacteriota bacterium]